MTVSSPITHGLLASTLALLTLAPLTATGQAAPGSARDRRQAVVAPQQALAAPASPDDQLFAQAAKLTEAEATAWIEAADAVLTRRPGDRTAVARKIAAHLSAGRVRESLIAYETWSKVVARGDDAALVRRIALEVLRRLRGAPSADMRVKALEALARSGDAGSRQALADAAKEGSTSPDGWQARVALARLGDRPSVAVLASRARQGMGSQRLSALDALRGMPVTPEVETALREALALEDHVLQGAAASIAGDLGAKALIPNLRAVATSGRFSVPLMASCALVALGDTTRRAFVDEALAGDLPDVKLLAARALRAAGIDGWQPALLPVLKDANPLNRLQAAAMLTASHVEQATPLVTEALTDPNPVVRDEAMRIIAAIPGQPLILFKRGLIDDAPAVRLLAATAIEARTRP